MPIPIIILVLLLVFVTMVEAHPRVARVGGRLSLALHRTPGSMIVLVAAGFFFLCLLPRFARWAARHGS